jgi:flagellar hook-length control protein FliK
MGLDESAIHNLLAQQPSTPATMLAAGLSPIGTDAQAATSNALQAAKQGDSPNADNAVATQLAAMAASAQSPVTTSGAGLAAAATTLAAPSVPGLTTTDMAAIQQLQITVLPAAVLPVNTAATNAPVPSTLDMLSLMGTGVDEQDVSALLSRFTEDAGSDSNPDQQQTSQGESNNFSSFAQALSRNNNAANAAAASAAPTGANMSEVYDQLSDKMATEMAARMHKQLSDGEWKMKFALRPSNLGGVEIQLEMKDGKLDAVFRADNPLTRDLLQNSSQRLREALGNFGINAGQVNVGQGGGNTQQNSSGNSNRNAQVRDNSTSQVNGTGSATSATSTRNKANASLLDLYA